MLRSLCLLFCLFLTVAGACSDGHEADVYAFKGSWEVELHGADVVIPFRLDVGVDSGDQLFVSIWNGIEVIGIKDAEVAGKKLRLGFPHYDSVIEATRDGDTMTGTWTKTRGEGRVQKMELSARLRAEEEKKVPGSNGLILDRRWKVQFSSSEEPAVGDFRQDEKGHLFGTFLTTTGDYRYLTGRLTKESFLLSCFDGAHAFVFRAKPEVDETGRLARLEGTFQSGATWKETWTAVPDAEASLSDGFSRSVWKSDVKLSDLEFPDLEGKTRKLDDPDFRGKARILQVFGSWCPNCHDAADFMATLDREYGERGLKILGVAFELTEDFERSARQVERYLASHGCDYPVLIAGPADKKAATRVFRGLDFIRSYPTTVFLDSKGQVRAVYSGFDGPATGKNHKDLKQSYRDLIEKLLAEG